ncbi:hypothetical protein M758_2G221500 [Ceratodon purpureus]|nr:hypothetical protein M758_2G221500 [Ceratodon purpureus]
MAGALVRKAGSQSASGGARAWAAALQQQEGHLLGDHGDVGSGGVRYSSSLAVSGSHRPVKRGTGGRSSVSGVVATVFGATGFLGRYVVQQLAKMGSQVMVPYRGVDEEWRHLKLMGDLGQIVPMRYDARDEDSIKSVISNSNVIVNCIGREYETRNFSYDDVNYGIADRISKLAKEHGGILKYVQMSSLAADPHSPSRLLRSKHAAEEAVFQNFPEATILRTAPLVGVEDRLLNRWAIQAKRLPVVPIPGDGQSKLQPVLAIDVAAAVVAAIRDEGFSMGKRFELGGPDVFTVNELVQLVFEEIREYPRVVHLPMALCKILALPREIAMKRGLPIPFSPSFSKDYLDQLECDLIVSPDAMGLADLGVTSHKIGGVTIEHLNAYRTGGPSVGTTVGESIHGAGF